MIVLKKTYDELFDLFIDEKHGALELYNETKRLKEQIYDLQAERAELRWQILKTKGLV